MGIVVILITVLVGLVSGLTAGLARESTSAIDELPADHLVFSAPAEGESPSFTVSSVGESTQQQWSEVQGVHNVTPLGIATSRAQVDDHPASVSAFGVPAGSELAPDGDLLDAGSVVLSTGAADDLGARVGDTVDIAGNQLTVASVAGEDSFSHTPVVWTDLGVYQELTGSGDDPASATVLALGTTDQASEEALAAADDSAGTLTLDRTESLQAITSYASENASLQLMRGFLFVISALVIGAFFSVWTIQRTGDIAVLKALGASTRYLLKDALGQAAVLLVLGTAVGSAIALGLGIAIQGVVPFDLNIATVLFPAGVLIILGIAGAALSIRRVTSVDPLKALGSAQ